MILNNPVLGIAFILYRIYNVLPKCIFAKKRYAELIYLFKTIQAIKCSKLCALKTCALYIPVLLHNKFTMIYREKNVKSLTLIKSHV